MSEATNTRIQEGALSPLKTPTSPPAQSKLVPLTPAPSTNGNKS